MSERYDVALLEPYYGGSHALFVDTLRRHSRHRLHVATMPPRKWKWRMRGASLWFARSDTDWMFPVPHRPVDAILCNDMLSVADLRALLPPAMRHVPVACYFHENQLTYPIPNEADRDYQYGMTNISSCLSADVVWFNTAYHRDAFLAAADKLLKRMPDCVPEDLIPEIQARSAVLSPPIDDIETEPAKAKPAESAGAPRILWSHRWEYDKNPGPFFDALTALDEDGVEFELVCVGEQFRTAPPEFASAWRRLEHRLAHAGYLPSRAEYLKMVRSCDVVVSTAIQENFGIAVLEAVASGCQPVVPNRLAYPEVIPAQYHSRCVYADDEALYEHLRAVLTGNAKLSGDERQELAGQVKARYGATTAVSAIDAALAALIEADRESRPPGTRD